jgi:hypothetical protein
MAQLELSRMKTPRTAVHNRNHPACAYRRNPMNFLRFAADPNGGGHANL